MLLKVKKLSKSILSSILLKNVDFELKQGEIHAIVGPNGAGKTSLIKVLSGVYPYDSGEIFLNNEPFRPNSPIDAQKKGIFTIHQEPQLVDSMSIIDNIFLGVKNGPFDIFVNWRYMKNKAKELLNMFSLNCSPNTLVSKLSLDQKYIVSISRAFISNAKIFIMDEPTAGLTAVEQKIVFDLMNKIKQQGSSIIYITHRIDEVVNYCDAVTILRDGQNIYTTNVNDITKEEIISIMSGRTISNIHEAEPTHQNQKNKLVLETIQLGKKNVYHGINLQLHKGEILGIAGAIGSGRSALLKTIFGEIKNDEGVIYINNQQVFINHPKYAIQNGIGYLTDDRLLLGILPDLSISENVMLASNNQAGMFLNAQEQIDNTLESILDLDIKLESLDQPVKYLSGGNQQKVLISRWMAANCKILLLDEPTKGVDISARNDIYIWMQDRIQQDCAIILCSSEISELIMLSTNIIVLNKGIISDKMTRAEATEERILKAMQIDNPNECRIIR